MEVVYQSCKNHLAVDRAVALSGGPGPALAAPGPSRACRTKLAAADGSDVHATAALFHTRLELLELRFSVFWNNDLILGSTRT